MSTSNGPDEEEHRDEREGERRPEPRRPADVPDALAQVGQGGRALLARPLRPRIDPHQRQAAGREEERGGGHPDGEPRLEQGHRDAPERRADRLLCERAHHALQAVRREDLVLGQELRDERGVAGDEQRLPHSDQAAGQREVPELERVGHREHRDHGHGGRAQDVRAQHHGAARQAVGDDARRQHQADQPDAVRGRDDRKLHGSAVQLDHLPGERDQPHPVARKRNGQTGPQEPEVAVTERAQGGD